MDLMSLLAKLTLDKTEYDKGLEDAEKDAKGLTIPTPQIPRTDNTEFKAGLDEAENTGKLWKEVMTGVWEGVKDAIVVTGITSAVMGVVGAMRQGIDMAIETGDAVKKGAANLGISTKAYQEYEYALGKSGLKAKDLNTAMKAFDSARAGNATKKQAEAFAALGINAEEAGEQFSSSGAMLEKVMSTLADYSGSDKESVIDAIFGSKSEWTAYFSQTSSEVNKLKKDAEDMGLIMSDDAIKNAAEYKDATEEIDNRLASIKRTFGESVLPMLTSAVKMVAQIVSFFSGSGEKSLAEMFAGDDKELADQLSTIEGTGAAAETLADKLLKMGDTSQMTAEQYAIWKGTAQELIKLVPDLGAKIDLETGQINANSTEIKENIKQWQALSRAKAVQEMKEKKFQEITQKNSDVIEASIEANRKAGKATEERVKSVEKINEVLTKYGIEDTLGKDATREDINAARQRMTGLDLDENGLASALAEFSAAESGFASAAIAEERAAKSAADLQKQVEDGMKDYEEWCASLETLYGTAGTEATDATGDVNALGDAVNALPDSKIIHIGVETDRGYTGYTKAIGGTIPYDNYPALLHRGEKVLTATQVRRGEGGGSMDLSGLKDAVISAIRSGMDGVTVNSYLDGKDITDNVNRRNMREVKGRRFA